MLVCMRLLCIRLRRLAAAVAAAHLSLSSLRHHRGCIILTKSTIHPTHTLAQSSHLLLRASVCLSVCRSLSLSWSVCHSRVLLCHVLCACACAHYAGSSVASAACS